MTKEYQGAKRGPKTLGLNYRYTILLSAQTKTDIFEESKLSADSITDIGRRAIDQYLAAQKKKRAQA
jgi:hypothetical protein